MLQQAPLRRLAVLLAAVTLSAFFGLSAEAQTQPVAPSAEQPDPGRANASAKPAQPQNGQRSREQAQQQEVTEPEQPETITISRAELAGLMKEVDRLIQEMLDLRTRLANAELEAAEAKRELAEMRLFLSDRDTYGDDFEQYTRVREVAEREARQRELEQLRAERERRQAEKRRAMELAREERRLERRLEDQIRQYSDAGFSHIGLSVFTGKMAYYYRTTDNTQRRVDYDTDLGHYLRLYPGTSIDFSNMTISGSVINADNQTRDLGVAIVFFDERGNQVGQEIVQLKNAQPDVPYPFTSTIEMALGRPFTTASTYVLYANPAGAAPQPQPTAQPQQ